MKFNVTILEINELGVNVKYPNSIPKCSIKATLKAINPLATSKVVWINIAKEDNTLTIGQIVTLDKEDFILTSKDTNSGNSITMLSIV